MNPFVHSYTSEKARVSLGLGRVGLLICEEFEARSRDVLLTLAKVVFESFLVSKADWVIYVDQ